MEDSVDSKVLNRSQVPQKSNYQEYRQPLRRDFLYSCGYCSVMENELHGRGFEIDHYLPQEHFEALKNSFENLVYSCDKCNSLKSDFFPGKDRLPTTKFILRPDKHDLREHYELSGSRLEGKTEPGKFTVIFLDLNREWLKRLRELRYRLWQSKHFIAHGVSELLSTSIDRIPQQYRALFLKAKQKLAKEKDELESLFDEYIKSVAASDILIPDPNEKGRLKARRDYLKSIFAIVPPST